MDLGLPASTAKEEEDAGMGSRNTKRDDRSFLVEDEILVARVLARVADKRAYTNLEGPLRGDQISVGANGSAVKRLTTS